MNANRKQKADEHKTLHKKISKLEQPPEDTREITLKANSMENSGGENSLLGRSLFTGVFYSANTSKSGGLLNVYHHSS